MNKASPSSALVILKNLRPLKWDEVPRRGDFVEDGHNSFEPWTGPTGFRADAFVKQIFRRLKPVVAAMKSN